MAYKYSFQNFNKETMARAHSTNVSISLKNSVETTNAIRNKKLGVAISYLERVAKKESVVPYKRYNTDMPHRKGAGIAAGGYPVNVANELVRLLKAAQKNASEQEIAGEIYVLATSVRKGAQRYHMGRYSGRKMKSTHVEVIVGLREKKVASKAKEVKKE
ncbi:MAG: 50S ribosomal protein L22 [Candidatus Woesearchaeota archaeon]|jgi:large subunit ribosomal protein L22|nr:50S ribosomal protein L22 [Candidatus Woesearchaeota archaeon]